MPPSRHPGRWSLGHALLLIVLLALVGLSAARHYHVLQALAGIACVVVVARWLRGLDQHRRV